MKHKVLLMAVFLFLPASSGCMGEDGAAGGEGALATAAEAGARAGDAPRGPSQSYRVQLASDAGSASAIVHPLTLETNPARDPVVLDLSGSFSAKDCRSVDGRQLEPTLATVSHMWRDHWFTEHLQVGDVFSYDITITFTNTDENWADIVAGYFVGTAGAQHIDSSRELRDPVVLSWSGQSYRADDDQYARLIIACWAGFGTVPYTATVALRFAENAIPSGVPIRVPVAEGAGRLFVRGLPVDDARGVLSHFRVFDPKDQLVCECVLNSHQEVATIPLPAGPGEYVILVDHTDNGFVGLGLDVPPLASVEAMETQWVWTSLFKSEGGAADATVEFEIPTVPLYVALGVNSGDDWSRPHAGMGKSVSITVHNARGEVARMTVGGYVLGWVPTGVYDANLGLPIWPLGWEHTANHHAYGAGKHTAQIQADLFRGEMGMETLLYVR